MLWVSPMKHAQGMDVLWTTLPHAQELMTNTKWTQCLSIFLFVAYFVCFAVVVLILVYLFCFVYFDVWCVCVCLNLTECFVFVGWLVLIFVLRQRENMELGG